MKATHVMATAHSRSYSDYSFTSFRFYPILCDYGNRVDIEDDNGKRVTVRTDEKSSRLDNGRFNRVRKMEQTGITMKLDKAVEDNIQESIESARLLVELRARNKSEYDNMQRLREILRCPEGESIFAHAYAVRAIADLTLERLNQK